MPFDGPHRAGPVRAVANFEPASRRLFTRQHRADIGSPMPKKRKARAGTKAAFVRNNAGLGTQELLTLAEKQGVPLTAGYVYNIRAADKAKQAEGQTQAAEPSNGKARAGSLDAQLRTLIIRVGLDRAEQIFGDLKASLSRMA
jgi:hypothetical protein